jgi:hypothetical protein
MKKIILAIPAAAAEIPPKPNIPATMATITQIINNLIIIKRFLIKKLYPSLIFYKIQGNIVKNNIKNSIRITLRDF